MLKSLVTRGSILLSRVRTNAVAYEKADGQTAMCPKCGIDSVISVVEDSREVRGFLDAMRRHWF